MKGPTDKEIFAHMTPIVIGLFIYAYFAEKSFKEAKAKAVKALEKDLNQ